MRLFSKRQVPVYIFNFHTKGEFNGFGKDGYVIVHAEYGMCELSG